ncbi:hypothetical protein H4219_005219 [Mycoemilia scoparia]|uniref:Uncharacterized protein n=1 Tax=Mycoemilia scoparia TaxID=417184 RepID=A0A9W8DPZ6_9FUNG|nr:hypothetical protein H4219_005219 [Mycoemilia scoparia]
MESNENEANAFISNSPQLQQEPTAFLTPRTTTTATTENINTSNDPPPYFTPISSSKTKAFSSTTGGNGEIQSPRKSPMYRIEYPPSTLTRQLIIEHFGYLPISFIDEIINAANEAIYRATDALTKFVEAEQGAGESTNESIHQIETLLEHNVDKNFDKFELYVLRNFFNIPKGLEQYFLLPHHASFEDIKQISSPHKPSSQQGNAHNNSNDNKNDEGNMDIEPSPSDLPDYDKQLETLRHKLLTQRLLKKQLKKHSEWITKRNNILINIRKQMEPIMQTLNSTITPSSSPPSLGNNREDDYSNVSSSSHDLVNKLSQLRTQIDKAIELETTIKSKSQQQKLVNALTNPTSRQLYLQRISSLAIERLEQQQQSQPESPPS